MPTDRGADMLETYLSRTASELLAAFAHGRDIIAEIEYGPAVHKVIEKAQVVMEADAASLCLVDPSRKILQQVRLDPQKTSTIDFIEIDAGVPTPETLGRGQIVQRPGTCSVCTLSAQTVWCASADLAAAGRPVGTLCVMRTIGRPPFSNDQMRVLAIFAGWAGAVIANAQKVRAMHESARAERERIAAHLHDNAAQNLSLLKLKLEQLEAAVGGQIDASAGRQLAEAKTISQAILAEVRGAFGDLRPVAPANEDLVTALATCVEAFRETAQLPVEFSITGLGSLPSATQTQALHIVREALVNVKRHARAQMARVSLVCTAESIAITIQDDGIGFDLTQAGTDSLHLGTTIMRERASRSGGVLLIETQPGRGTRVTVQYPLSS
jgi:signal transduction histidine kinase